MRIKKEDLQKLISNKLHKAGLLTDHADIVADVLVHADMRGVHSHGAMRVEYYAERISKGGTTINPDIKVNRTGPCSAVMDGDNAAGHVVAKMGMDEAINIAKENGIAIVGMRRIGHSGALSYFVQQAAKAGFIGLSFCQSDPMAVPYGGAEPYFGTNPIAFCAPSENDKFLMIDLAVTVQAWGKILHARSKKENIPADWAVDKSGVSTTDPFNIGGLVHIAGPKGYALALMVDVLSGVLMNLAFGSKVTSMYNDLSAPRNLGQMHIVIDPAYFGDKETFLKNIAEMMSDLNAIKPAPGVTMVKYPGQSSLERELDNEANGTEIVDEIYNYLISDDIHYNNYDGQDAFADSRKD